MLTTFQTKIDYLINQVYQNMIPESQNELVSLIQYTQALDLFEFTAKSYHIQQTEILLNVSLCWEILGNSKQALEYLNKALAIVPNQPSLILYKSILLLSLNLLDESQRNLLRYKQLGGCSHSYIFYYDTFRILFYYVLKYEDDVILSEINEYIAKYTNETHNALANNSFAAFYYIRSVLFSNCALKQKREETKHLLIKKYEENISKAYKYHHNDTCFYIQEGINRDNLSKAFMMIFPYITQSKPKMLVNYKHMVQGLKLFYVLFKAVKLFKIKLKRKKIKMYYIQQLKFSKQTTHVKEKDHSVESKEENIKSTKNINTCNESVKTKSNKKKGKNDSSGDDTDRNSNANQSKKIDEIKKEFLDEIRNLYKSVWVYNYALLPKQKSNNEKSIVAPVHFNYFIRNGYYSSSNLKENIIKGITYNEDYKLKLNQQQEKRGVQLLKVNNNDRSNNKINSGNNNSNAKTESSAPSQISTYSNAKTGDNEETVKKIHQYNSTKEIKQIQSSIPLQLNYQTEMKSHSNERINYYNNNNSQFNLIDVSDYNETNDKLIPDTKNDMIIKKNTPNKPIELCSNYKQIVNSNKSLSNNQPSSSLLLKKNIPQAKTRSDLLHLVSKKNNYKHCNVSIEKFIKFRNIRSAHKYHMSLSKENDYSNSISSNCLNSNMTNVQKPNTVNKEANKDNDININTNQQNPVIKPMNITPNKPNQIPQTSSSTHIQVKEGDINQNPKPKSNKNPFIKRKQSKDNNSLIRQKNSSTRRIGVYQIKYNFSFSTKKDDSSLGQLIHQLDNSRNRHYSLKTNENN